MDCAKEGVGLPGKSGRGHLQKAEKRGFMLEWAGRKSGRGIDRNRGGGAAKMVGWGGGASKVGGATALSSSSFSTAKGAGRLEWAGLEVGGA